MLILIDFFVEVFVGDGDLFENLEVIVVGISDGGGGVEGGNNFVCVVRIVEEMNLVVFEFL